MAFKKGMELREQAKDLFVANNAVKVSELEFGASRCDRVEFTTVGHCAPNRTFCTVHLSAPTKFVS